MLVEAPISGLQSKLKYNLVKLQRLCFKGKGGQGIYSSVVACLLRL